MKKAEYPGNEGCPQRDKGIIGDCQEELLHDKQKAGIKTFTQQIQRLFTGLLIQHHNHNAQLACGKKQRRRFGCSMNLGKDQISCLHPGSGEDIRRLIR